MEISRESIEQAILDWQRQANEPTERRIILHTGVGGMDLFEEATEGWVGLKRVRIGKKVPRILQRLNCTIRKSRAGYYYKLVKNGQIL